MKKKATAKSKSDQANKQPPTIQDARDALLLAAGCWACAVDGTNHSFDPLEAFVKHAVVLHDFEFQWTQFAFSDQDAGGKKGLPKRPHDIVLDNPSGWHGATCSEIVRAIDGWLLRDFDKCEDIDDLRRRARDEGLPSNYLEAMQVLSTITELMKVTEPNEKYIGLRYLYEQIMKTNPEASRNDIAREWKRRHPECHTAQSTIANYIKKCAKYREWIGE